MNSPSLPHHRLQVWQLALELVLLVHRIRIADAKDRQQAREAVSSCARNIAEGAARRSRADKARVYAIARGECGEAVASVELSGVKGGTADADVERVVELGSRVSAILYRLG